MAEHKHTNALIRETSPYLLQHAHNPVQWYPWSEEALNKAREEDKPILLSVGYSACHWCHVMERESFENEEIAAIMNDRFVCIKVDREERPDIDALYMQAVQLMTGHGGWPMTVFLTPDQKPFYGGTYYPPEDRRGLPGFPRVLRSVANAFRENRDQIVQDGAAVVGALQRDIRIAPEHAGELSVRILDQAAAALMANYDSRHGGFGAAPKFPASMALEFLLRCYLRTRNPSLLDSVEHSLQQMASGGIYDHLGGGFHRYSVDAAWLVPHFEKMLYDNALLSRVYLYAFLLTGKARYRTIVEQTLDYVLREMTSPEGGFYSTQDADSEGEEGKFYTWERREIEHRLGLQDAELFCRYYGVTEEGNLEGRNVLYIPRPIDIVAKLNNVPEPDLTALIHRGNRLLVSARAARSSPGRDEKIVTAWNGLMIRTLAETAQGLGRADYGSAAARCARFLMSKLESPAGLLHCFKDGEAKVGGFLDDYACVGDALLSLYEADFHPDWLDRAVRLSGAMIERFKDADGPGFFLADDDSDLVLRTKDLYDNATPSGNSVAAWVLLRLSRFTGRENLRVAAISLFESLSAAMRRYPSAFGNLLCALDLAISDGPDIAILGQPEEEGARALLTEVYRRYLPNRVLVCGDNSEDFLLRARKRLEGRPTAYVCRGETCLPAVDTPAELGELLDRADGAAP